MKTETLLPYLSGAADVGGSGVSSLAFRSLFAADINSLVSFYLQLDFDARRHRFGGAISDNSIRLHCNRLKLDQSVVLGCFDTEYLTATTELHPLFDDWEEAELAVVARQSSHTTNILGQLLQLTAFVAGGRGCHTLIVPFSPREHRLVELLRGMGRVRVHDEGARVDITAYAGMRRTRIPKSDEPQDCFAVRSTSGTPSHPKADGSIATSRVEKKDDSCRFSQQNQF